MNKVSKLNLVFFGSFVVAMLLLALMIAPDTAANGPAVVIYHPNGPCSMLNPDGEIETIEDETRIVVSNNEEDFEKSNAKLKCKTTFDNPPPNTLLFNPDNEPLVRCIVNVDDTFFFAIDWHQTISSSGESTLTCKFKK